ncbi:MAG: hypothetical protein JWO67_6939 [Streptosporangiaceae bacterium]|nr:hypothetical protein [Streptosporangiaceae bacterium]
MSCDQVVPDPYTARDHAGVTSPTTRPRTFVAGLRALVGCRITLSSTAYGGLSVGPVELVDVAGDYLVYRQGKRDGEVVVALTHVVAYSYAGESRLET